MRILIGLGGITLYYNQCKSLYPSIERLARVGYTKLAEFIFTMFEWLYHTAVTANNLAAFYEEHGITIRHFHFNRIESNIDVVKYYYTISYQRKPNVRAACSLGYIAFQNERYREALFYYKKAFKIRKRPELYYNIAVQYSYLKQFEKAVPYLNKAICSLRGGYKRQASLLLIYVYAMLGYMQLAKEHYRNYISTYKEVDMDLLQLAFICQEYDYIDRNCLALSNEVGLRITDVEVVLRSLYLVEKKKLADYFLKKCLSNPSCYDKEQWEKQCQEVSEKISGNNNQEYIPSLQVNPILHKKMYSYKEPSCYGKIGLPI